LYSFSIFRKNIIIHMCIRIKRSKYLSRYTEIVEKLIKAGKEILNAIYSKRAETILMQVHWYTFKQPYIPIIKIDIN